MLETHNNPCSFDDVQDAFNILKECKKHLDYYLANEYVEGDRKYSDAITFFRNHAQDKGDRQIAEIFDENLENSSPLYLAYLGMKEETARMSIFGINYKQDRIQNPDITISSYGKKTDLYQRIPYEERVKLATMLTHNEPKASL